MAVKNDGSLWAWGENDYGQFGDGNHTGSDQLTPKKIMDGVSAVACGRLHSIILKTDGTVWACGDNHDGQIGDGSIDYIALPVQVFSVSSLQ